MRYELNLESQIVQYEGDVQSIADKKTILTQLFSQGVYECTSITNDGCEWTIEYRNTVNDIRKTIVVYYGNIRNEDRNDKEKKIQLNSKDPRANANPSIILGVYCYESNDSLENLVFAGWSIDPDTNYPGNPSIRGLNIDSLQKARFNGLYKHNFRNNYVCTFRPEYIFYYIENIQLIHNLLSDGSEQKISIIINEKLIQKIFYGAPGTGKSHKVKELVQGKEERTERVTFHPEYDYNAFVGGYKPTMDGKDIRYEFVPQAFTKIYCDAWNSLASGNKEDFYLIIEEINRGNCAEIFGDIFQLLDRNSDYDISPSKELNEFLLDEEKGLTNKDFGLQGGKLKLPSNLNIMATMNTSDQSLFPMDSAFKRRWDWEYIPINYDPTYRDSSGEEKDNTSSKYKVKLSDTETFSWLSFIKSVNSVIKLNDNLGMDKCIGNYFIKPATEVIDIETFINKAIFYLWNDVFKDEMEENNIFLNKTTYEDFYPIKPNGIEKVKGILENLKVEITVE